MIVGHLVFVPGVTCWMAEVVEGDGILGDEVAYDYAHGAVAEEVAGGIVVGGGDGEFVACGESVAAGLEEGHYGNRDEVALRVHFCRQNCDLFVCGRRFGA